MWSASEYRVDGAATKNSVSSSFHPSLSAALRNVGHCHAKSLRNAWEILVSHSTSHRTCSKDALGPGAPMVGQFPKRGLARTPARAGHVRFGSRLQTSDSGDCSTAQGRKQFKLTEARWALCRETSARCRPSSDNARRRIANPSKAGAARETTRGTPPSSRAASPTHAACTSTPRRFCPARPSATPRSR